MITALNEVVAKHQLWGFWKRFDRLRLLGHGWNHKRVYRVLGDRLFAEVNRYLQAQGLRVATGTIVDATLIAAPSSTKNEQKARDPEMHQTRKGKQWHFGMKAHIDADSQSKLIHSVAASAANMHDKHALPHLPHGAETRVWDDSAYQSQGELIRAKAPKARDFTNRRYRYQGEVDEIERTRNRTKSKVRAKVEHVFAVIKLRFGNTLVRYRGLRKNAHRLFVTCALANLFMARRHLLAAGGVVRPECAKSRARQCKERDIQLPQLLVGQTSNKNISF